MSQQSISRFFSVQKKNNAKIPDDTVVKKEKVVYTPRKRKVEITSSPVKFKKVKLTDLEQQVWELKRDHFDKLLLVQVGYRYKFFGEDAQIASRILNIKLIDGKLSFDFDFPSKDDHLYSTFAQASIPLERLLVHVRRLLVKGYVVAVVDQKETAALREGSEFKGKVFERKLSHVYSPGTFITDEDLERNVNGKSIACINESCDNTLSIVSANVFVSKIVYDQFHDDFTRINLESRLHHLEPIEIITIGGMSSQTKKCIANFIKLQENRSCKIRHINVERTKDQFSDILTELNSNINNEDVFAFLSGQNYQLIECFQQLIRYIKNYNLHTVFNLLEVYQKFSNIDNTTILDANVISSLEIFTNSTTGSDEGSLFAIINKTMTKFGGRTLRNWLCRPLVDLPSIIQRHEAVEYLMNKMNSVHIERVIAVLKNCPDLELMMARIYHGRSNRKEVYSFLKNICNILAAFLSIRNELISLDSIDSELLSAFFHEMKDLANELSSLNDMLGMIHSPNAIDNKSEDHIINYFNTKFLYYSEIQNEIDKIDEVKKLLDIELDDIRKTLNNKDLQFFKVSNEPYLIQIRNSLVKNVPNDWIRVNATANCVRFRSPKTLKLYKKLQYQQEMLKNTCNSVFQKFTERLNEYQSMVAKLIRKLAMFDVLVSFAIVSNINNYNKPKIVDFPTIKVIESRNPIAERLLKDKVSLRPSSAGSYIDNDFTMQEISNYSRIGLITGPNMGGKSSFMRQIGLIVILSQIGCFVPCANGSILGLFANIHIRLGSNDDIFSGKSTFQVELSDCRNMISACNKEKGNTLLLIDELGRGTSTVDGCSIAWSVLDYLANDLGENVVVLFITHFKELEAFETITNGIVKNYHLNFSLLNNDQDIIFTYKITPGSSQGSYGVYCAKIAGMPNDVVTKAQEISHEVELQSERNKYTKLLNIFNTRDIGQLSKLTEF
ncbi:hypothetical protein CANINC_000478 [Pichia inconspicua]|uniref:DNA mismatch repair protein MSH3 n=1 Tax=Pichia inconspicua TaxID=52247 RepID=A0A4T0X628_9ASCO|nr:hypothetical protein CANINC_000478 [[Candida] inconspicua]